MDLGGGIQPFHAFSHCFRVVVFVELALPRNGGLFVGVVCCSERRLMRCILTEAWSPMVVGPFSSGNLAWSAPPPLERQSRCPCIPFSKVRSCQAETRTRLSERRLPVLFVVVLLQTNIGNTHLVIRKVVFDGFVLASDCSEFSEEVLCPVFF